MHETAEKPTGNPSLMGIGSRRVTQQNEKEQNRSGWFHQ
jgi:hypothetical protein